VQDSTRVDGVAVSLLGTVVYTATFGSSAVPSDPVHACGRRSVRTAGLGQVDELFLIGYVQLNSCSTVGVIIKCRSTS